MMRRLIYSVILLYYIGGLINAQTQIPINFKSPQTYEMEKFGNIPISYNTGSINFSLPLFSVQGSNSDNLLTGGLSYNSSGFIPSKKSNYVGLNWYLNYGGAITREVKGVADDFAPLNIDSTKKLGYWVGLKKYTKTNSDIFIGNFEHGPGNVLGMQIDQEDAINLGGGVYTEINSDKYNFNFLGITGYFYIGNDGKPLIFCDDSNVKVDLSGYSDQTYASCIPVNSEIKITDGQGIVYYFGGSLENLEVSYNLGTIGDPVVRFSQGLYSIQSWYLKKIVYPSTKEVNFYYKISPQIFNNFCSIEYNKIPYSLTDNLPEHYFDLNKYVNQNNERYNYDFDYSLAGTNYWGESSGFSYDRPKFQINLVKKVFPDKIVSGNTTVEFTYDNNTKINSSEYDYLTLKSISVKYFNNLTKKIDFNYYKNNYYTFLDKVTINDKVYSFDYYKKNIVLPPPTTFGIDFWGYWNGGSDTSNILIPQYGFDSNTGDFTIIGTSRNASSTNYDTSLLKRVTYPTKGYTDFFYEPHDYSKRIDKNSTSFFLPYLKTENGTVGGARISKMIDNDGVNSKIYEYKYKKDFSETNLNGESSGISNYYIRYFDYYNRAHTAGGRKTNQIESSNNVVTASFSNSPINYNEVSELLNGKLRKKYIFSGIDKFKDTLIVKKRNIQGTTYYDYKPQYLVENLNLKFNSQEDHRGKLIKTIYFNESDTLKVIENQYIKFRLDSRYLNYYVSSVVKNQIWLNYYKEYFYPSLLNKIITSDYLNGKILKSSEVFNYDTLNRLNLIKKTATYPDMNKDEITYNYAYEKSNQKLIEANMVGIPLETITLKNGNPVSKVETLYPTSLPTAQAGNLLLPLSVQSTRTNTISTATPPVGETKDTELTYDRYDSKANLLQYSEKGLKPTTIIWGYNQTQPIAKIEGAKYDDIKNIQEVLDAITASNADAIDPSKEGDLLTAFSNLRSNSNLSGYNITTYTYDPLIGVTSITPPNGMREIYKYDSANRLQSVVDVNGNILKEYKYNYQTPYYNIAKSQTFTRNNCGIGYTGGSYTYTVSEGKYSSMISQADADAQAQTDINSNGQNMANANGLCIGASCSVSFNASANINGGGGVSAISNNYKLSFGFSSGPNSINLPWTTTGVKIATINGNCRPKADYTSYNGQVYYTIKINGDVILRTTSILPNNTSYNYDLFFPIN